MTHEEIEIAYRKRLLVTVKESNSLSDLKGGVYVICKFGNCYNRKLKSFDDYVGITDPKNPRTIYEIDAYLIEPMPGVELVIQNILDNRAKALSKEYSKHC